MAYNFPNSPSNGDTVTISNVTYTYNSTAGAWKTTAAGGASGASVTSSDTAPSSPSAGDLWYDTTTLRLYVYYNDGSSSQWVKANPSGSSGALVQESAPTNPAAGNLWFDPSTLETYVYYNDGDSNQWVQTNPAASSAGTTVYSSVDDLPLSGVETGAQAFVSSTSRLYLWNGTGWYNIALINTTPSISGANASYDLATDGTATTVTITATDPEGFPITYSIASDTSGNVATVTQGTGASANVFTITPSTNSANAGTFSLTFRASDGVNIATAVSSFTLVFRVQNSNYTTALITSVGANNAVNNSFTDSSTNNHTITANGNVTQNTFSPYRHGGYSTYFDGTGDWVDTPNNADFYLDGEFTIEFWVYLNGTSYARTIQRVIAPNSGSYTSAPYISIGNDTGINGGAQAGVLCATQSVGGGNPQVYANETGTSATGTPVSVPLQQWVHCALSRDSSNNVRLWQDGVLVGTFSNSSVFDFTYGSTVGARIGRSGWGAAETLGPAYLRDFRILKGTALYTGTSSFNPPTEPITAVTNTKLLFCHLPYIKDGSTSGHALTVSGDIKTEPFGPYDYRPYSSGSNGASMYFDGSGDYLSAGSSSTNVTLSGDFCIEAWIYKTATTDGTIIGNYLSGPNRGWSFRATSTNLYLYFQIDGGAQTIYQTSAGTTPLNLWNHVVWCRNGTDTSVFVNGSRVDNRTLSGTSTGAGGLAVSTLSQGYVGYHHTGSIADARVVNGSSVYDPSQTTLTVPTAPLTAVTNTSLLVSGTNAGIIDKSQSVKTLTLNGDVKSSTTQSKYLTSSMYFDGTGDYLTLVGSGDLIGNASKFTIEGWYYPDAASSGFDAIYADTTGYATAGRLYNNNGTLTLYWANTSSVTGSSGWTSGQWNHFAVTYDGTTTRVFIDGSQVASTTAASFSGTADLTISNSTYSAHGYISDFRVTKGLARYTSSFTAPTAALQG